MTVSGRYVPVNGYRPARLQLIGIDDDSLGFQVIGRAEHDQERLLFGRFEFQRKGSAGSRCESEVIRRGRFIEVLQSMFDEWTRRDFVEERSGIFVLLFGPATHVWLISLFKPAILVHNFDAVVIIGAL